jgi:hypothetical protein
MNALTANRLDDGAVVYWTGAAWSLAIQDAALLKPEAAESAIQAALSDHTLVGPYLMPMNGPGEPGSKVRAREALRAAGPSIVVSYPPKAE